MSEEQKWDGRTERRKGTSSSFGECASIPECRQIFIRIEEKMDDLIKRDDQRNGRFESHVKDYLDFKMDSAGDHSVLKGLIATKVFLSGALVTLVLTSLSVAVMSGINMNQIKVNSRRLDVIEEYHLLGKKSTIPESFEGGETHASNNKSG